MNFSCFLKLDNRSSANNNRFWLDMVPHTLHTRDRQFILETVIVATLSWAGRVCTVLVWMERNRTKKPPLSWTGKSFNIKDKRLVVLTHTHDVTQCDDSKTLFGDSGNLPR